MKLEVPQATRFLLIGFAGYQLMGFKYSIVRWEVFIPFEQREGRALEPCFEIELLEQLNVNCLQYNRIHWIVFRLSSINTTECICFFSE